MRNNDILNIAIQQSAIDSNCHMHDFKSFENKVVISRENQNARKYPDLPFLCDLTSYGNNIVASVSEELSTIVTDYINKYHVEHYFETPNLHVMIEKLKPFNMNVCFMAEYFLPDMTVIKPLACDYETKILEAVDFADLYLPEWNKALCEKRKYLDKLAQNSV